MHRHVADFWPLGVAVITVPIQGDLLILFSETWRLRLGLGPAGAIVVVILITTAKMAWTYWFWGWLFDLVADTERIHRLVGLARSVASLARQEGYVDRAFEELRIRREQAHRYGRRLLTMTKWAGCFFLFGVGSYPVWGVRSPALLGVGVAKFREGFYALALGNAVRTAYLMGGILSFWAIVH
ncbi:MAG: hypothetical protein IT406_02080 [Candidatus Yanofskybacteria bacterium]|nr:hypothetical protein [Candidatus Yanofskybacteria bacterium]